MGLRDLFRRSDDPQRQLMRMPLKDLDAKRIETEMEVKSLFRQIERLRAEFSELIEKGRASASQNEQQLLARQADTIKKRIDLMQRDFDGLNLALGNLEALTDIRRSLGDRTKDVEQFLGEVVGLPPHQFRVALEAKRKEQMKALESMRERDSALADYTDDGASGGYESESLRLMRQEREPPLPSRVAVDEEPAQPEPAPVGKPAKEKQENAVQKPLLEE